MIKNEKKMKYCVPNPRLDALISDIRRKIRLSMNGIVSDKMTQSGIEYKKNYGVSIPRIKEIASAYSPNHDLAQRLWFLQVRETMIMATILEPINAFTPALAQSWISQINQIELAEQVNMNLFCKLTFSPSLCCEWVQSDNVWKQISGFILAARIVDKLSTVETIFLIDKAVELSVTSNLHLYKAQALCLSRMCRKDKETVDYLQNHLHLIACLPSTSQQYILSEVKQEIFFLNI
jgi:3-methyladenine DNA glycosylase AlkD